MLYFRAILHYFALSDSICRRILWLDWPLPVWDEGYFRFNVRLRSKHTLAKGCNCTIQWRRLHVLLLNQSSLLSWLDILCPWLFHLRQRHPRYVFLEASFVHPWGRRKYSSHFLHALFQWKRLDLCNSVCRGFYSYECELLLVLVQIFLLLFHRGAIHHGLI